MERKQGLVSGFLGQKGEHASEDRDASSGTAVGSEADDSPSKGKQVDAYEEDWYRSLKALAERRAQTVDEDEGEAPAASQPPDQRRSEDDPQAPPKPERPAAEAPEPPAPAEPEQPAAEVPEPPAPVEPEQPAAEVPEPPAPVEPEQAAAEVPGPSGAVEPEGPAG